MTAAQQNAFEAASGVSISGLTFAVAGALSALLLFWAAWVALAQFKLYTSSRGDAHDVFLFIFRSAIVALLLGYFIR